MVSYFVRLTKAERHSFEQKLTKGHHTEMTLKQVRILLRPRIERGGGGTAEDEMMEAFGTNPSTTRRVQQAVVM